MSDRNMTIDPLGMDRERGPLPFALFGLARFMEPWIEPDWRQYVLDLGPGRKQIFGATGMDWPEWDANEPNSLREYMDASVGGIYAVNLLEHLEDPRHLLREMARVLAPGCPATVFVPHGLSDMYLQDLDHKHPFNTETIGNFFSNDYYDKDHGEHGVTVGATFVFGLLERNLGVVTQFVKNGTREAYPRG